MRHTLHRDVDVRVAIAAGALAVLTKGATLDTRDYGSNAIIAIPTAVGGAGGLFKIQESDTDVDGDFTDADTDDVLAPNGYTIAAAGYRSFGYIGIKRYIRLVATPDTSMNLTAMNVKGEPKLAPINPAIS